MTKSSIKQTSGIKDAADRLQRALKNLEVSLAPMLDRINELEQQTQNAHSNDADSARKLDEMAGELGALQTKHDGLLAREQEFSKLAGETSQELDAVITQVLQALDNEGEG